MKVSVLIPTHNRAALLREAIESVRRQTVAAEEIIVIDDGSEDDTPAVAKQAGVGYLRQDQGGKSKALNNGFRESRGDCLIVLDDDDLFPPRALELHVKALGANAGSDFSYGRFLRFNGAPPGPGSTLDESSIETVPGDERRLVIKLMDYCFLPHPVWMARRQALERAGPYDENALRSQDLEMILRLSRVNEGAFVDEVVLYQRQHGGVRPAVRAMTGGDDPFAAWRLQDRRIFEQIARTWSPDDFRPVETAGAQADQARAAWLQRGAVMLCRGVHNEAFASFETHAQLLGEQTPTALELRVAARLFAPQIPIELTLANDEGRRLRQGLRRSIANTDLRDAIVAGGRWHIAAAARRGDLRSAGRLTSFMLEAFGSIGIMSKLRGQSRDRVSA